MKASIIIAAYNIETYIRRCIISIINQTLKDIEIIVVNDGSTDNTLGIIKELYKLDNRIIIVNQENKGLIEARKSGLNIAKGEYILFVDGDDWLEINTLELLYNNAKENKSDIIIYNAFLSYDDRKEKFDVIFDSYIDENDYIKNLFLGKILPCIWSRFIKLEFIKSNNIGFPSDISFAEDLAASASLFMYNPKVSLLKENLYNYYQRGDSITNKKNSKVLEVDKALSFIHNRLREKNLYNKYKEEFEYMVYKHLFSCWFLKYSYEEELNIKLYKQYLNRNISIKDNPLIRKEISSYPLSLRIRVKSYHKNYKYGKVYDNLRRLVKGN